MRDEKYNLECCTTCMIKNVRERESNINLDELTNLNAQHDMCNVLITKRHIFTVTQTPARLGSALCPFSPSTTEKCGTNSQYILCHLKNGK